jgi:soluble lytic murein transglycosylase-like protein
MKKYQILAIALVIGLLGLWGYPTGLLSADPTDDLSLYLAHAPARDVYKLMSERKVAEVFADNLDLFPKSLTPKLAHHVLELCKHYRFDPAFILSLIQVESGFHVKVQSSMGAIGLMQLMPATAQHMVDDWDLPGPKGTATSAASAVSAMKRALTDPFFNITMGVAYLSTLRDHYQGRSPYFLLAAYNVGPARMDELLSRRLFKPDKTVKYYDAIRRGVTGFRYYKRTAKAKSKKKHVLVVKTVAAASSL